MPSTRYPQRKEQSAELLRLALGHMGRHEAAFNPLTFAVWYEYCGGANAELNAARDQRARQSLPVDDAAVAALYQAHIASADASAIERIGQEMQQLMKSMAQSASQTGSQAGVFGDQLDGLTAALESKDVEQLAPRLHQVRAGTVEMKGSVQALEKEVIDSQAEIHRLRHALQRARGEALLDPLTGILNRKGFDQTLRSLLAQPTGEQGSHCLVMLDIDHFKKVNDAHGHLMGDRVIQGVSEILRTSVTDPSHAVARYGGEEFAILVPRTSVKACVELAEAVRRRTKAMKLRHRSTQEVLLTVSISGGLAEMRPGDDAATLIARADAALYQSKALGRDRLTCA